MTTVNTYADRLAIVASGEPMVIYLAGPMTGMPEHNFPLFNEVAKRLRDGGHAVFNPAENGEPSKEYQKNARPFFMRKDIYAIVGAHWDTDTIDCVALLPEWERSRGARLEVEIAAQLDIPVVWADDLTPLSVFELEDAAGVECDDLFMPGYDGVAA